MHVAASDQSNTMEDILDTPISLEDLKFVIVGVDTDKASPQNSKLSSFEGIRQETAVQCGQRLRPQDVVSLFFLLIDDALAALNSCGLAEEGKFGLLALACIIRQAQKLKLQHFNLKLVCALHLLRKYQVHFECQPCSM